MIVLAFCDYNVVPLILLRIIPKMLRHIDTFFPEYYTMKKKLNRKTGTKK
jgi:hypothetical protein